MKPALSSSTLSLEPESSCLTHDSDPVIPSPVHHHHHSPTLGPDIISLPLQPSLVMTCLCPLLQLHLTPLFHFPVSLALILYVIFLYLIAPCFLPSLYLYLTLYLYHVYLHLSTLFLSHFGKEQAHFSRKPIFQPLRLAKGPLFHVLLAPNSVFVSLCP